MKYINLKSFYDAYHHLNETDFKKYLEHFKIEIKANELEDLSILIELLSENSLSNFNNFFIGYKINQISKEFDLLRFGDNDIVNIEIKRSSSEEKVEKQLKENRYYLEVLNKEIYTYTFVVNESQIYQFEDPDQLNIVRLDDLIECLNDQTLIDIHDVDSNFNPSNYLVSPFNSTDKFINNQYFLTDHQRNIKNELLADFANNRNPIASIVGNPGTGKTLLTYDIANHFMYEETRNNVLVIHCGFLNEGHRKLNDEYGWTICPIRSYISYIDSKKYDVIIVDEAQRIRKKQIEYLMRIVNETNAKCIFSYDPRQCFSNSEFRSGVPEYIKDDLGSKVHRLTDKIRSNKEIAAFITNLFDLSKKNPNQKYRNIDVQYFSDKQSAKEFITTLSTHGWKAINYTNSLYNKVSYDRYQDPSHNNAHHIIGQEFDKVIAVMDSHFYHDERGRLDSNRASGAPDYDLDKMLYQILTRARQKITLVIIDNPEMLQKCLYILDTKSKTPTKKVATLAK